MPSYWTEQITTKVHIAAPPATVFSILTTTAAYPAWNPFILSLTPSPLTQHTTRLTTSIKSSSGSPMTFQPVLQQYKQNESLVWLGRLLWGGLFDGLHGLHVVANGDSGGSVFVNEEKFSGLVIWIGRVTGGKWYRNLMQGTEEGFNSMNQALKQRADAGVQATNSSSKQ